MSHHFWVIAVQTLIIDFSDLASRASSLWLSGALWALTAQSHELNVWLDLCLYQNGVFPVADFLLVRRPVEYALVYFVTSAAPNSSL